MAKKNDIKIVLPVGFDVDKSYALQRLMQDTNHKEAVEYIINDLCGTYKDPTDTNNTHMTYRNIGRASVGRAIVEIYKMNLGPIKKALEKEKSK